MYATFVFQFLDTEIASSDEKITRAVTWITSDSQNNIWISVDNQGLFCYNRGKKNLTKLFLVESQELPM